MYKKTAIESTIGIAMLAVTVATTEPFWCKIIVFGASVADSIRKVAESYVKISDPAEQSVFETVWALSTRLKVRDFDALAAKRYDEAYGIEFPTEEELRTSLAQLPSADVNRAISDLVNREILLREAGGRLKIAF